MAPSRTPGHVYVSKAVCLPLQIPRVISWASRQEKHGLNCEQIMNKALSLST
ncbi:hypothetical protein PISMIDRAFT_671846 [Pisolithus microcarpus 441]|uniref:Uncharacterized protein n=1 Tax=Pisolithus microcarpus 441 TaxID=765257 RepID=A0A0D0ACM6_9AGAM|nr:hypothetical protein PISMIDRAFT_671846 [Pisolithus microcarpus 441]